MTTCTTERQAFVCPGKWDLWRQLLRSLPWGRAWQTHADETWPGDPAPDVSLLTPMQQYWAAFAEVLAYFHEEACGLLGEMFCRSVTNKTLVDWLKDLGMPDECERYDNICDKFVEDGGARCEDLVGAAAARGWSISCRDCSDTDPARSGAPTSTAGCAVVCDCPANTLWITIDTANSPAYVAPTKARPRAGCARVGCNRMCDPDTSLLVCVIDRIRHAHLKINYEVI